MNEKKVSIIVPVYNGEKTIERCLESILKQSLEDIEVIVVDDGSTDMTQSICQSINDERLLYYHKDNGGVSTARNLGMSIATGEYIGFVDADDYILLDMCEKMYNAGKRQDADMCICDYYIDFEGKKTKTYTDLLREGTFNEKHILEEILPNFLGHIDENGNIAKYDWAIIRRFFKRDFIVAEQLMFDETLSNSEDCLFSYIATYKAKNIVYLKNEYLYINVRNSQSLTRRYLKDYWEQRCRIMDAIEKLTKDSFNVWESNSFLLFVMRCVRPSFINISYGFDNQNFMSSVRQIHTIITDCRVRKMCEFMDSQGLNNEWKKEFVWCKNKNIFTVYWYYKDIYQGDKICHMIRKVQKYLKRKFR